MKVQKIQSNQPIFKGIKINANENKEVKYLYNKVLDVVREKKIGGTFATDYITLATEKQSILDKLKEFGIKFIKDKK